MADVFLRPVPAFANPNDVELLDPTAPDPAAIDGAANITFGAITVSASGLAGAPSAGGGSVRRRAWQRRLL